MRYLIFIVISSFVDIFIKDKIESDYEKVEKVYNKSKLKKYISLNKLHNYGFPFGKLKKFKTFVKYAPGFITLALFIKLMNFIKVKKSLHQILALTLIIAGAISNIRDRFKYTYVVDYFSFKITKLKNIVFNLGDIYIIIGSILYTLGGIIFG